MPAATMVIRHQRAFEFDHPSLTPEALTSSAPDFLNDLRGYISPEIGWESWGSTNGGERA
jgi:hypothetical protein